MLNRRTFACLLGATALAGVAAPARNVSGDGAGPGGNRRSRQLSHQERRRHHRRPGRRAATRRHPGARRPHRGRRPRSRGSRRRDDRRHRHDRDAGLRRYALPHVERARPQLRRRRLRLFRRQERDVEAVRARRLLQQRDARPGGAGQCRRHHRAQLVAQHAHAGACRRRIARAPRHDAARALFARPCRPDAARRAARFRRASIGVQRDVFRQGRRRSTGW